MDTKHETRMKLYKQGLSDGEIARRTGASKNCVSKWRSTLGLPNNCQRNNPKTTLCNNCIYVYGNECPSIPVEERPWVKRYETIISREGTDQAYRVNYVFECERHREGRIPLNRYRPERMAAQEALRGIKGQVVL